MKVFCKTILNQVDIPQQEALTILDMPNCVQTEILRLILPIIRKNTDLVISQIDEIDFKAQHSP